jgi:hypothetical protein
MQNVSYNQRIKTKQTIYKKRCLFCDTKFKDGDAVEEIYLNGAYNPFCLGHLEQWVTKQHREWILNKL